MVKDNFLKEVKIENGSIELIEKEDKRLKRLFKFGCAFLSLTIIYLLIDCIIR